MSLLVDAIISFRSALVALPVGLYLASGSHFATADHSARHGVEGKPLHFIVLQMRAFKPISTAYPHRYTPPSYRPARSSISASLRRARAILRRSDTSITVAQNLCDLCPVALMENVPAAVRLSTPPDGRAMSRIRYAAGRAVKFGSGRQTRPPRRGGGPGGRAPRPRGRWRCRRGPAP